MRACLVRVVGAVGVWNGVSQSVSQSVLLRASGPADLFGRCHARRYHRRFTLPPQSLQTPHAPFSKLNDQSPGAVARDACLAWPWFLCLSCF